MTGLLVEMADDLALLTAAISANGIGIDDMKGLLRNNYISPAAALLNGTASIVCSAEMARASWMTAAAVSALAA
jgi:hypothetical protein